MLPGQPQKILVTFLMHLGDLLLTTPFIEVLRRAYPQAQIDYLVDKKLAGVVQENKYLSRVLEIDKKGQDRSIGALYRYAQKLSQENYDLVINLHPNERTSFLTASMRAKYKVGACHFLFRPFYNKVVKLKRQLHAADMYLEVLRELGISQDLTNQGLQMPISTVALANSTQFYQQAGLKPQDKLIGLNIGSAVLTKRWPGERFAQVADTLSKSGYKIVFFGGSMDTELVEDALSYMQTKPIVATGKFSLQELAAAMQRCSLIITNDSGPMHVAISQKVPIVAMYGPSSPKLYGPYTERAVIVTAEPPCLDCAGGMRHQCEKMDCMRNLTVQQVLQAAQGLLRRYNG